MDNHEHHEGVIKTAAEGSLVVDPPDDDHRGQEAAAVATQRTRVMEITPPCSVDGSG